MRGVKRAMKTRERADLLDLAFSCVAQLPNDHSLSMGLKIAGLWGRLTLDVVRHWSSAETSGSERRAFVRAAFAALDAFLSQSSRLLIFLDKKELYKLKPEELSLLQEKRVEVDSKGDAITRDHFTPFSNKLRFVLNLAGRFSIPTYRVDVGDSGWQALRAAINTRDQLTHPKEIEDLEVQDEDLRLLKTGLEWLATQILLTILLGCLAPICRKMHDLYPLESSKHDDLREVLAKIGPTKLQDDHRDLEELLAIQAQGGFASEAFIVATSKDACRGLLQLIREKNPGSKLRDAGSYLRQAM